MIYSSESIEIREAREMGLNHLEFRFNGHFSSEDSLIASRAWVYFFEDNPEMTYSLVWDCTDMTGFDPAARKVWYQCLKRYKPRIIDVVVISKSIIIRGAARVMLEVFGIGSRIVKTREDLFERV